MIRKIVVLICLCISAVLNAANDGALISLRKSYQEAFDLNVAKKYNDAYAAMRLVERQMLDKISKDTIKIENSGDIDFNLYFNIRSGVAEIAYVLGLYSVMSQEYQQLSQIVSLRKDTTDEQKAKTEYYKAHLAKIKAGICILLDDYHNAELELRKAIGGEHYYFTNSYVLRSEFAQLYYKQKLYDKALAHLDTALIDNGYELTFHDVFLDSDLFRELTAQRAICLARLKRFAEAKSVMDSIYRSGDREWLRKKAKILMLEYDDSGVYNPAARQLYRNYLKLTRNFIDTSFVNMHQSEREQFWLAEQPFATDCYRLEEKDTELLYDVALFSKALLLQVGRAFKPDMTVSERYSALRSTRVTWQQVKTNMPLSSVAIEFITYERKDTSRLAALVLCKNATKPVFVDIAPVSTILNHELYGGVNVKEALTATDVYAKNLLYTDSLLPALVWTPSLLKSIGNNKNVYFAADGILHQLAIEYILPQRLSDKTVYRLTSTRLLTDKQKKRKTDKMLLCGGIEYSIGVSTDTLLNNDALAYSLISDEGVSVGYLNASKSESDSIIKLRNNPADTLLTGLEATEESIRKLMGKYNLLHFATHGYFSDNVNTGTELVPMQADRQLSNNCLFLSASDYNLHDRTFNASSLDGLLTARELGWMELSNSTLIALSACQSGIGYLTVDGIFGLQRGLKTAGANAIIVSLWDVDDNAASYFFLRFYANLEQGQSLKKAFDGAREYLKTTEFLTRRKRHGCSYVVDKKTFDKPQYYNAFVLIDGIY